MNEGTETRNITWVLTEAAEEGVRREWWGNIGPRN